MVCQANVSSTISKIQAAEKDDVKEEEVLTPLWNGQWYAHPNIRGKSSASFFFPFPDVYMEKFTKARKPRGNPVTKERVQEVVLPWEKKYFSPMLRG